MDIRGVSVIIPSYNPDEKLGQTVDGLLSVGFTDIIIVNDGSRPDCAAAFAALEGREFCTVLSHPENRGKGAALKTAFAYYVNCRDGDGVITVDGDGQHLPADVRACAERMLAEGDNIILGCRDFSLPYVPKNSRRGNKITSFVFLSGCGMKVSDTQTGLRAIPAQYMPIMLTTRGDRFEYETNMLLEMKTNMIPYIEVPIETVYIEENKTSHFHPVRDSIRIYKLILKFIISSGFSAIVDILLFYILQKLFDESLGIYSVLICTASARLVSSLINFFINKKAVFSRSGNLRKTLLRYYCLAIPQMLLSAGIVEGLSLLFGNTAPALTTLIKLVIDILLFFVSFGIQREWVFKREVK